MRWTGMTRLAGALLTAGVLALGNVHANAQAGATPPTPWSEIAQPAAQPPTADDVCRTLEQAAAENALPVEFFARVIWQESRFNARAVSSKGAKGIAQFMPHTANWHGLGDPFNPIEALRHSAAYLRELRERFGNLGLAAAAYNAGPGRISAWLINHRNHRNHRPLPGETRNYVAIVTGRTADEWASPSSPQRADTTIPQGVPCTRLANLVLAPRAASPSLPQTETIIAEGVANLLLAPRQGVANLLLAPRAASPSLPQNTTIPEGVALLLAPRAASPSLPQNTTIPEGVVLLLAPRGASPSPPQTANTTIPEGVALLLAPTAASTSLPQTEATIPQGVVNLVLAPRAEEKHVASYVPRWGLWLAADLSESKAWALYRERMGRFASLIGDREPVVLFRQLPGMGRAKRYIIAIADDDRAPLDKFCEKLTAAGSTCDVMRNEFGP
jgi:Transglycosylase SLT domain